MKRAFWYLSSVMGSLLVASMAFAHDGGASDASNYGWYAIATALAIGLPALGGAL